MLQTTGILETSGVSFTIFQFFGAAFKRWEAYERRRPVGAVPLTWKEFSVLFSEKFMPQARREELRRQFQQLRQDGMSTTQYELIFSELAHHAIWLVPTDRERIKRFIDGLTYQLRLLMTRERVYGATFNEVVDIARQIEVVRSHERSDREAKRPRGSGSVGGVPSGGQFYHNKGRPVHYGASSSHGSYSSHQSQSSLSTLPTPSTLCAPPVLGSYVPGPSGSYSSSRGLP
ncbi:uncharacterized protein [Nicotiana tomentosiformis]|uniref:uncharacterized protein n=1 Tax=Nicotiana tomentosiformis TaxID=4098 RepID=UPI00388C95E2